MTTVEHRTEFRRTVVAAMLWLAVCAGAFCFAALGAMTVTARSRPPVEIESAYAALVFGQVLFLVFLWPLFEQDGLPISEVGQRAGLAKSSMTTIVRGLVKDGLVRLEEDSSDHRVRRLYLTRRARDLEQVLTDGATRLRHRVTATLGIQGQQQLHRTLQRLLDTL